GGAQRRVVAMRAIEKVDLTLEFTQREHIVAGAPLGGAQMLPVRVSVKAPGYMPRILELTAGTTSPVDAHLDPAPLRTFDVPPTALADLDLGTEAWVSGRCDVALPLFDRVAHTPGV